VRARLRRRTYPPVGLDHHAGDGDGAAIVTPRGYLGPRRPAVTSGGAGAAEQLDAVGAAGGRAGTPVTSQPASAREIALLRLVAQRIAGPALPTPAAVV